MLLRAFLKALLLVSTASYILFSPTVLTSLCGGIFLLFPMPPGDEYSFDTINNVKREEVFFPNSNGDQLHGWFFQAPQADAPVVMFTHGNAGNIGHRLLFVHHLMNAGASVFLYDYRSYGKSKGTKSLTGLTDDAEAAYKYLTETRKIPSSRLILYGESIGGGPTCALALRHPCRGIILDSTFTSLLRVARKKVPPFKIYPDFLKPVPEFDNTALLRGGHAPLLIIHGEKDEIMPVSEAHENFALASEPKTLLLLPNSTHNDKSQDIGAYESAVQKFLGQLADKP